METIQIMKNSLQQMLDELFNGGVTKARNHFQPLINLFGSQQSWIGLIQRHYLNYNAPATLDSGVLPTSIIDPPSSLDLNDKCVICLEELRDMRCAALGVCKNHIFHHSCLEQALKLKPQCPICRVNVNEPQGKSPPGSMTVMIDPRACSGFECTTIVITYDIPAAIQLSYHENPGQQHEGKFTSAYLPNNSDGQNLLKRLKYAFLHGLLFTVGRSLTMS